MNKVAEAKRSKTSSSAPPTNGAASMNVVPLGDNIVVKRMDAETHTPRGIVLPDAAQTKPRQGRVLSVGDGRLLDDGSRAGHQVREGDRVLFSQFAGAEVEVNGQELLIMSEDEVLAIMA